MYLSVFVSKAAGHNIFNKKRHFLIIGVVFVTNSYKY
jgi:hypothetical protein